MSDDGIVGDSRRDRIVFWACIGYLAGYTLVAACAAAAWVLR